MAQGCCFCWFLLAGPVGVPCLFCWAFPPRFAAGVAAALLLTRPPFTPGTSFLAEAFVAALAGAAAFAGEAFPEVVVLTATGAGIVAPGFVYSLIPSLVISTANSQR